MTRELEPAVVARRLAALATSYVPETVEEGRARLRAEATCPEAFATAVARRLDELRALDELTRYLRGRASVTAPVAARVPTRKPDP
jgi:hypothetical protein